MTLSDPAFSLILQPRSLLVFKDLLYTDYLHGIAFREADEVHSKVLNGESSGFEPGSVVERKLRISLTIRVVNKVLKNVIKL